MKDETFLIATIRVGEKEEKRHLEEVFMPWITKEN